MHYTKILFFSNLVSFKMYFVNVNKYWIKTWLNNKPKEKQINPILKLSAMGFWEADNKIWITLNWCYITVILLLITYLIW